MKRTGEQFKHSHRSEAKMLEFKYTEGDQIVSFQTTLRGVHIDYYVEAFKCFLSAAPLEALLIRLSE